MKNERKNLKRRTKLAVKRTIAQYVYEQNRTENNLAALNDANNELLRFKQNNSVE